MSEVSKKTLETAIEALEYYKKINYIWSASSHPKYEKCMAALEELKKELIKTEEAKNEMGREQ